MIIDEDTFCEWKFSLHRQSHGTMARRRATLCGLRKRLALAMQQLTTEASSNPTAQRSRSTHSRWASQFRYAWFWYFTTWCWESCEQLARRLSQRWKRDRTGRLRSSFWLSSRYTFSAGRLIGWVWTNFLCFSHGKHSQEAESFTIKIKSSGIFRLWGWKVFKYFYYSRSALLEAFSGENFVIPSITEYLCKLHWTEIFSLLISTRLIEANSMALIISEFSIPTGQPDGIDSFATGYMPIETGDNNFHSRRLPRLLELGDESDSVRFSKR